MSATVSPLTQGAILIVLSELLIVTMSSAIKVVSLELPNEMLVFFRNLFGLLVLLPVLMRGGLARVRTTRLRLHLLRAAAGMGAMYCFFYTIAHMPLAEATLFALTAPFLIPVMALLWMGESIPRSTWLAIAIGFAGVAAVLRPGSEALSAVALIALLGAACSALARVVIRRMSSSEPSTRIVGYFALFATLISAVPLLWAWQTPSREALAWLLLMGCCASAAHLLFTRAYSLAPAGQIGPFTYVSVVLATVSGWLFWGEVPHAATFAGMALIAGAGALILRSGVRRPVAQH